MTTAVAEELTGSARLDAAVKAVCQPDSTLDDLAFMLRELGRVDYETVAADYPTIVGRFQALCWFAGKQIDERFAPEVRAAPPSALAEVVRDVMTPCLAPSCSQSRAPWQSDVCQDADCEREFFAAFGESAS